MDIQDITINPGLLTIKTNKARLLNEYFKFIHPVELDNYIENINMLESNIIKIGKLNNFDIATETLQAKFASLKKSFENIYPRVRNNRGLINIVGSGIKFITGNMDNEDAIEINNKINEITLNNKQLIKEHNIQIQLNHDIINRFKDLTNHINNQQTILNQILNQINSNLTQDVTYMQYIFQIDFNIITLKNHFNDLSECIKMAKLNILPKNIMSQREIEFIKKKLTEQKIEFMSDEHVYEHLNIQAYYNGTKLIFIINVPIYDEQNFNEYFVEPIGNKENKTIIVPHTNILSGLTDTFFEISPCMIINNGKYCNLRNLKNINNDTCFKNLMNNQKATCNYVRANTYMEIKQLTDNIVIIKNCVNLKVTSNCNFERKITGHYLIKLNNCIITINGIIYENTNQLFKEEQPVQLMHGISIKENMVKTIDLKDISESHIKNMETIEELHLNETKHNAIQYTTIVTIIFITLIILYKLKSVLPLISSEPRSEEGGVMSSTQHTPQHDIIKTSIL